MLVLFNFERLVVDLLSTNVFVSQKLLPRATHRGVRYFYSLTLVVIETIDHVKEADLAHFENFAIGTLTKFGEEEDDFGDKRMFKMKAVGVE